MTVSSSTRTVLDALIAALRAAGDYNRNDQDAPAAILWTDGERQWEPLLARLRQSLPIVTLGAYDPGSLTGPAYWLRCVVARALPDLSISADGPPILYLPGVSRGELRAVEECPRELQPLSELQYRGQFWTHRNGRDWTVAAFLQSEDGGLGIDLGSDGATRDAIGRTLSKLADESVERLRKDAPLRAPFFDSLIHPGEVRNLLQWLSDPVGYRRANDEGAWAAFRGLSRDKYGFDPETDGAVTAGRLLGERQGPWELVWQRFTDSPRSYNGIPGAPQIVGGRVTKERWRA